jgi:hypothetical protein
VTISAFWYGQALMKSLNKEVNWSSDTIRVALLNNTYTPNQDSHQYFSDVNTYEVTGTGYTAGGTTLTTKTMTYDSATNVIKLDADDTSWANSTITARYAVIYDDTPSTASTKPLLGYVDFGADQTSNNAPFTIAWDANGIFKITVS